MLTSKQCSTHVSLRHAEISATGVTRQVLQRCNSKTRRPDVSVLSGPSTSGQGDTISEDAAHLRNMELSPKEEVKRRLRMVLVADRCGMSPASLAEMKRTIVKALQDFVDIEGEDGIEVNITTEPGLGTVYSVNIPVRRVKAEARFSEAMAAEPAPLVPGADGVMIEWDPEDYDSNPANRFPMGC